MPDKEQNGSGKYFKPAKEKTILRHFEYQKDGEWHFAIKRTIHIIEGKLVDCTGAASCEHCARYKVKKDWHDKKRVQYIMVVADVEAPDPKPQVWTAPSSVYSQLQDIAEENGVENCVGNDAPVVVLKMDKNALPQDYYKIVQSAKKFKTNITQDQVDELFKVSEDGPPLDENGEVKTTPSTQDDPETDDSEGTAADELF